MVTLLIGVGISSYILSTEWTSNSGSIVAIKWCWVIFPYLMSFCVLVIPAHYVRPKLAVHKDEREATMREEMRTIRSPLASESFAVENRKPRRDRYEYLMARRAELHQMRTLPFSVGTNLKFGMAMTLTALTTGLGFAVNVLEVARKLDC